MSSMSSSSVTPLSFAYCRWKVSCSALPPVSRAATVARLRSFGESCGRFHASPKSTSSVKCTSPGAKWPNICSAPEGSVFWSSSAIGWRLSVEDGDGQGEVVAGGGDDIQSFIDGAERDDARAGNPQAVACVDDEDVVVGRPVRELPDPVGEDPLSVPGQRPRQRAG